MQYLVPCNPKYFNIAGAFADSRELYWKQTLKSITADDIVYIYVAQPVGAIKYKCLVLAAGITDVPLEKTSYVIDGSYYVAYPRKMKLKLLEEYPDDQYPLKRLRELGIKGTIQGQRHLDIDIDLSEMDV